MSWDRFSRTFYGPSACPSIPWAFEAGPRSKPSRPCLSSEAARSLCSSPMVVRSLRLPLCCTCARSLHLSQVSVEMAKSNTFKHHQRAGSSAVHVQYSNLLLEGDQSSGQRRGCSFLWARDVGRRTRQPKWMARNYTIMLYHHQGDIITATTKEAPLHRRFEFSVQGMRRICDGKYHGHALTVGCKSKRQSSNTVKWEALKCMCLVSWFQG